MAQTSRVSVESSFIGGLKTEFTGLNFPENACTDTENCIFTLTGNVLRRLGIDYEVNYNLNTLTTAGGDAIVGYKWNNAGGDGETEIFVLQIGGNLFFFNSTAATVASPLSDQLMPLQTVALGNFLAPSGSTAPNGLECSFADGNGYLFIYHSYLDPIYCTYTSGTITPNRITLSIRDFAGCPETVPINSRPPGLNPEHSYNIENQGWTLSPAWSTTSASTTSNYIINDTVISLFPSSGIVFIVDAGLPLSIGDPVSISGSMNIGIGSLHLPVNAPFSMAGTITGYSGTTMQVNVTSVSGPNTYPVSILVVNGASWNLNSSALVNLITTFESAVGSFPSNADIWYLYKNSSGVFSPSTTLNNVTAPNAPARKGHFILQAFNQQRSQLSGVAAIDPIVTSFRPKTGTWFQGRVWYTGVDSSVAAGSRTAYTTFTENIYFSPIIEHPDQFGQCYQQNDPTDENFFSLLPSDGGVIVIQGAGSIYELFPVQNGMLARAANGIWFITGSQGIGFTANDYTITKISGVKSISRSSTVSVNGLPIFWNEEGIYAVEPAQQGLGMVVNPITIGTILSFYNEIPVLSKMYARGSYDPINYEIRWLYRSTQELGNLDRLQFDRMLVFNTYTKAFSVFTLAGTPTVAGIVYVSSPGGLSTPDPTFKMIVSNGSNFTFADEHDERYLDWFSVDSVGTDYTSYFVTGYKLHGHALALWQPEYVYMYSDNTVPTSYKIQGIWNYANSGNSGKYSQLQLITNDVDNFGVIARRHKIRGHGLSLQLKVISVTGEPFNIIGWAMLENINAAV